MLTFTPAPNAFGSATVTVTLQDSGGTANPGDDDTSDPQSFTIIVLPVNDPPVAINKNYAAQANMKITIPDGGTDLLVGASDIDGPAPLTVGSVSATTPAGGNITSNAGTGAFDFDPPPGATGNVSFTYTVCDGDSLCSTPATVSFNVSGPVIWFVDAAVAGPGDGRLSNPFKTLAGADAVDAANQRIFLFTGIYATGLNLNTGEALIGQGVTGTTFDALFGINPPSGTLARPSFTGTRPTVQGTVALAGNSTVRGLNIASTTATGLSGGAVTGVSVSEASVTSTTGTAVNLNGTPTPFGGTVSLTAVSASGGTNGIVLNNTTGSFTVIGNGTAGSGGTIQNKATGISLTDANNVSLTRMQLNDFTDFAIRGSSVVNFTLDNTVINGVNGNATSNEGSVRFKATFDNNQIGVAAIANSGSREGSGLKIQNAGLGAVTVAVTNNQIRWYNNFGIELLTGGGALALSGALNSTVTGNTIANPGTNPATAAIAKNGIHLNAGTIPGDTYQLCLDAGGSAALQNSLSSSGAPNDSAAGGEDIRLRQRQDTTVRLRGYTGTASDNTAVQNYVIARNGGDGVPSAIASNNVSTATDGFFNTLPAGAACPLP